MKILYCVFWGLLLFLSPVDGFTHCPRCERAGNVVQCHNTLRCAGNQVCQGTMENLAVSTECAFPTVCQAEVYMDAVNCTGGASFQTSDRCHFCCSDLTSCGQQLELVQKGIDGTTDVLHCPTCPRGTKDPHVCLDNLQPCRPGVKVCSVEWSLASVSSGCATSEIECRLHESHSQHACQEESLNEDAFCTRCCDSPECWFKALYVTTTSTSTITTPTTTPTTPITTPTSTPTTPITTPTTPTTTPTTPTTTPTTPTTTILPTTSPPSSTYATTSSTTETTVRTSLPTSMKTVPTTGSTGRGSTSSATLSAGPTVTGGPVGQSTVGVCKDNVRDEQCLHMPGVCQVALGHLLCPLTCGFCDPSFPSVVLG